jgi:hypothetical protein
MGALTSPNAVWYPDLTDVGQPNVNLATMAQSIDAGIGARLQKQEILMGLFANIPTGTVLSMTYNAETLIPVTVNAGVGFNQGMTIAGGVITITQAGIYAVACGVTTSQTVGYLDTKIYKNAGILGRALTVTSGAVGGGFCFGSSAVSLICAVGDTISLKATPYVTGSGATALLTGQATYNTLSATLLKAM